MQPRQADRRKVYLPGCPCRLAVVHIKAETKYSETLKVRIDPELLEMVRAKAKELQTDVSTYVRWCILTGVYLSDLNNFVRRKGRKE